MRIRQVTLATSHADQMVPLAQKVMGLGEAFYDPEMAQFGGINAIMPAGDSFLEIIQPTTESAPSYRHLQKTGGDAAYMFITQVPESLEVRERLKKNGIRTITEGQHEDYIYTIYHPGDFGGIMISIDHVGDGKDWLDPKASWPAAGPDWQKDKQDNVLGVRSVTVQNKDPEGMAKRWSELVQKPVAHDAEGPYIQLATSKVRFHPAINDFGVGMIACDFAVRDAAPILAAAKENGLKTTSNSFSLCNTEIRLVQD